LDSFTYLIDIHELERRDFSVQLLLPYSNVEVWEAGILDKPKRWMKYIQHGKL